MAEINTEKPDTDDLPKPTVQDEKVKNETLIYDDWKPDITATEAEPGLAADIAEREKEMARKQGVKDPKVEGSERELEESERAMAAEPPDMQHSG